MRRCDIVIVNYNAGNLLADCVQSVLAEGACHVFVVDNDSHDDSLAHLSASISDARVTIIRNAGQPDMEVVVREQGKEVRFKGAGSAAQGQGVRAGVAYQLEDGNIVYIPETRAVSAPEAAGGPPSQP